MKKSIIFFAAIAAFFSCSKEKPVNEIPTEETFSVELFATAPSGDADTKTTLVDGDGTKFVHWSKGDAVKVLFFPHAQYAAEQNGASGVFNSNFSDATSSNAYFRNEGWDWQGVDMSIVGNRSAFKDGIAVYPHTATAVSKKNSGFTANSIVSEVSFDLPSSQVAVMDNIESNLNFSYARVSLSDFLNTIYNNGTTELTFRNACAMIEITMPTSFAGKKVTSISVSSNDGVALTGKGKVDLGNTSTVSTQNIVPDPFSMTIIGDSVVELTNEDGFELGRKYYVVVWPGSHPSGLTIEFKAEDGSVATKTTKSVNLNASMVKPYGFNSPLDFKAPTAEIPEGATVASVVFKDCGFANKYVVDNEKIYLDDAQTVYAKFTQGSAGTAPTYYTTDEAIRMYQNGSKLEVSAPGKTIVSIEFTFASNHWYLGTSQGELSAEGATRVWTGEAETVNFVSTGTDKNHRAYVSAMKVIYL